MRAPSRRASALAALFPIAFLVTAALAGLGSLSCFGGERPRKGRVSALWIGAGSAGPTATELAQLESAGIRELFLETGRLEWAAGVPRIEPRPLTAPARRLPATLVVVGSWPAGELDSGAGEALANAIGSLRQRAEQAGLLPVGVHFDAEVPESALAAYGGALGAARRELGGATFVSATLDRSRIGSEPARVLARSVDFLVCFLYGQRPGEPEDAGAWDLQAVEERVRALERLGRPYLSGAATVGSATWIDRDGGRRASTTEADLRALVDDRRLALEPGFSLASGADRQMFEFTAKQAHTVGRWSLAAGDRVRVVKTATPYVEEYLRRTGAWDSPNRLGDLFFRQPGPGERLAVSAGSLAVALAPEAATPRLEVELERPMRAARAWRVRLRLRNRAPEPTDLAFLDSNYVELRVTGGTIGDVDPGGFRRFDLLAGGERGTMRAMRRADTVRLFAPIVEGGEVIESGDVEIRFADAEPLLTTAGSFLLPEGRLLPIEPQEWSFGER